MSAAIQDNISNAPVPLALSANRRSADDFHRASRHSQLVKILRAALPVLAGLVVLVFVGSAILSYVPVNGLSIGNTFLKDGKLIMEDPKMAGFDRQNRPYDVKAQRAIQDLTKTEIVELEKIVANIPIDDKSFALVNAVRGTYHSENETLALRDDIVVSGARGMDIELETADIDMKSGGMTSDKPVKVFSDRAIITADSVKVEDSGKTIIFERRVRTTVKQAAKLGAGR